jgi:G-protein signaling modulator 2
LKATRINGCLLISQSSRLEDQRSVLPEDGTAAENSRGPTVPDEDFFSLIARLQEGRMDDQRADIKDKNRNRIN